MPRPARRRSRALARCASGRGPRDDSTPRSPRKRLGSRSGASPSRSDGKCTPRAIRVSVSNPATYAAMKARPSQSSISASAKRAGRIGADGWPPSELLTSSKSSACAAVPLTSAASSGAARRSLPKIRHSPLPLASTRPTDLRAGLAGACQGHPDRVEDRHLRPMHREERQIVIGDGGDALRDALDNGQFGLSLRRKKKRFTAEDADVTRRAQRKPHSRRKPGSTHQRHRPRISGSRLSPGMRLNFYLRVLCDPLCVLSA